MFKTFVVIALVAAHLVAGIRPTEKKERESFASSCETNPWPYARNTLAQGEVLKQGEALETSTAKLSINPKGNLELVRKSDKAILWETATTGNGVYLAFEMGGTLALWDNQMNVLWMAKQTNNGGTFLVLQDDCNFVMYEKAPLTNQTWSTDTQACVNVHLVMHSHDDVGWLLTPERYYDGCFDPNGGVQSIIGNMIPALAKNSSRKFVQVEQYFFNRWWVRQNATTQALARKVVESGQLDFINGGWSMHDEACVHQEAAISNMEAGAQFLRKEFGNTFNMSIGWHIDPFGHASATPRLMSQMAFDAFFFWRTDYEHREYMLQTKTMETMWNSSPSLKDSVQLFTSIMYDSYCMGCFGPKEYSNDYCPSPFCCFTCEVEEEAKDAHWSKIFSRLNHKPKKTMATHVRRLMRLDDKTPLTRQGIAAAYVTYIKKYASGFRTNNVLVPWGCDFQHIDAEISFNLMDDILEEINSNPIYGMNIFYSTPEEYVAKVANMNYTWPVNNDDYFLDSDSGHSYWSGYLSSRAEFKGFERHLMNERVATEIAFSATPAKDLNQTSLLPEINKLREACGIAQHHDAITGTERVHVRNQYQNIMTDAWTSSNEALAASIEAATGTATKACLLANLSSCVETNPLMQNKAVSAFIFNPLAWERTEIVTIPVPRNTLRASVKKNGKLVPAPAQVQTTWNLTTTPDPTAPDYESQLYEILVEVRLAPLGITEVVLEADTSSSAAPFVVATPGAQLIRNEFYVVNFDNETQMISDVTNLMSGKASPMHQNIAVYCPMGPPWYGSSSTQNSGAYIFRTCTPDAKPKPYATSFRADTVNGPLCREVRQTIKDAPYYVHQTVRVCNGQEYVELTSGIGAIYPGEAGSEVVMKISTNVESNKTWFTDSQALEMQRRVRDSRPNYPYTVTEPVAANFFPSNAFSFINDTNGLNLAVTADRSRATASLEDGELEFLVLRRLLYDDGRGVDQALNEDIRLLSTNRIIVNSDKMITDTRNQTLLQTHKPVVRFGKPSTAAPNADAVAPIAALPPNVFLHTRTLLAPGKLMVRLQHLFAEGEGPLAVPVKVDIKNVLPNGMSIVDITETDINGIQPLASVNARRQKFKVCRNGQVSEVPTDLKPAATSSNPTLVSLAPMDIRTFILHVEF